MSAPFSCCCCCFVSAWGVCCGMCHVCSRTSSPPSPCRMPPSMLRLWLIFVPSIPLKWWRLPGHAGAIPLPVTLTMLLGERISAHEAGARVRLYSPYPFPERRAEGGLHDAFGQAAWDALQRNPVASFHRVEEVQGRPALRYATADLMRPSCVNCHNTHPASPKTGWKTRDVRGVLEVIFPLDTAVAQTRVGLGGTFALMTVMAGVGLSSLALAIGKLRRGSADLDQRARRLESVIAERQRVE